MALTDKELAQRESAAQLANAHLLSMATLAAAATTALLRAGMADSADALSKVNRAIMDATRLLQDERRG